jgi:exodeoxyribonuclease VII small subunit
MKKTKNISYQDALQELLQLQTQMETNQIPIDELDIAVKRATELLSICKEKLRTIENNITETLKNNVS